MAANLTYGIANVKRLCYKSVQMSNSGTAAMKFVIVYCMSNGKEIAVDAPTFSKRDDAMAFKDRRNAQQHRNAHGFYAVNEVPA